MAADVPTWRQIEEAALNDPVLHRVVSMHRAGLVTREQALMMAALALVQIVANQQAELVKLFSRLPPDPGTWPVTPGT